MPGHWHGPQSDVTQPVVVTNRLLCSAACDKYDYARMDEPRPSYLSPSRLNSAFCTERLASYIACINCVSKEHYTLSDLKIVLCMSEHAISSKTVLVRLQAP